jgi:hypothetical protein
MSTPYARHNPYSARDFGADDEPNADRKRDACPDCGRPRCRGGCPQGRAAIKALRARLADPSTYADPEF